ncbi:DUF2946 family protein [Phyllobacterium leguminum]|uniref:DUF2946 family protein n=1 Tax=Phyllobacterium leguminum TaxID=314237 RepID=A0A318T8Z9_9HYPH|nr:DUF2946 family protein [Phyllobacterium leguminum]PYE89938.1 hypothetical protein C7477_10224 [Phyllobacterium leguminum]
MRFTRQLLKDRLSAGAIALLMAYLLVLQSLLGIMAQSAMATSALGPLHVICTSTGAEAADPGGQGGLPQKAPECPCASLCQLASGATPAILNSNPDLPVIVRSYAVKIGPVLPDAGRHLPRGLIGQPRAPPVSL